MIALITCRFINHLYTIHSLGQITQPTIAFLYYCFLKNSECIFCFKKIKKNNVSF